MKVTELQLGDYVNYRGQIIKVTSLYDKGGSNEVGWGIKEDTWVNAINVEPIPLTPEILEKNGFVTKDKPDHWTGYRSYKYSEGSTGIIFHLFHDTGKYKWSGKCEISLNAPPYWIRFEYLHELQHILKICGINKEMTL